MRAYRYVYTRVQIYARNAFFVKEMWVYVRVYARIRGSESVCVCSCAYDYIYAGMLLIVRVTIYI